jgi:hypothetical protein
VEAGAGRGESRFTLDVTSSRDMLASITCHMPASSERSFSNTFLTCLHKCTHQDHANFRTTRDSSLRASGPHEIRLYAHMCACRCAARNGARCLMNSCLVGIQIEQCVVQHTPTGSKKCIQQGFYDNNFRRLCYHSQGVGCGSPIPCFGTPPSRTSLHRSHRVDEQPPVIPRATTLLVCSPCRFTQQR